MNSDFPHTFWLDMGAIVAVSPSVYLWCWLEILEWWLKASFLISSYFPKFLRIFIIDKFFGLSRDLGFLSALWSAFLWENDISFIFIVSRLFSRAFGFLILGINSFFWIWSLLIFVLWYASWLLPLYGFWLKTKVRDSFIGELTGDGWWDIKCDCFSLTNIFQRFLIPWWILFDLPI